MRALQDLEVLVRAADAGSLSAAARALGLTPAAASAALKRVEAELGVPLFVRSTRSLRLTAEGESFLAHCRRALEALRDGCEALALGEGTLGGPLQLSAPSDFGRNLLLPWLDEFLARYPGVQLRLQLSDRLANVYRQPVDIALRYGDPPDSNLVALPLAPDCRRVLCASPDYLARRGTPATPEELAGHDCLCFMLRDYVHDRWRFERDGEEVVVPVTARRIADDGEVVHRWALAGQGVAYKSRLDLAPDLAAGRLRVLCPEWIGERSPLYFMCPDRRQLSPVVQLLRAFLQERCGSLD